MTTWQGMGSTTHEPRQKRLLGVSYPGGPVGSCLGCSQGLPAAARSFPGPVPMWFTRHAIPSGKRKLLQVSSKDPGEAPSVSVQRDGGDPWDRCTPVCAVNPTPQPLPCALGSCPPLLVACLKQKPRGCAKDVWFEMENEWTKGHGHAAVLHTVKTAGVEWRG